MTPCLQRRIIGVDLGGTKLLAGAVDPDLGVHHRTQRTVTGLDQRALLDVAVDAVSEARESAGAEVEAVGFGIPVLMDRRTGTAVVGVNTPLPDIAFADVMAERLGLPVFVDNDGNCAALAEHRAGAARGASEAIVLTLGTGIAGGLILRDELYRGALGAAGEIGHMVIDFDGPACQGNCPNRGCAEMFSSGTALAREAHAPGAPSRPESGLARDAARGPRARRPAGHRARPRRRRGRDRGDRADRLAAGHRDRQPDQHLQSRGRGRRRRGDRRRRAAAGPGPGRGDRPRAAFLAENVRIVAARFGVEAGMVGAAALAYDRIDAGQRGRMSGRLIVCPTPIGNLEDVTLRVLAALREADVVACEDTRRTRVLLDRYGVDGRWSATTSTTSATRSDELVARMREGATVALVSDAGMPLVSDPG